MTDTTTRDAAKAQFSENLHAALDRLSEVPKRRGRATWVKKEFRVSSEAARKWLSGLAIPDQTHIAIIANRLNVDPAQLHAGKVGRKSKKDKDDGWLMRPIVAINLKRHMDRFFDALPHIGDHPMYLAEKAELGKGTIQRTLSGETGASIDTLEAIARVLGIAPFEFLVCHCVVPS